LNNILPEEWSQHGPGNYTFRYKHDQSSLEFVVKVAKLGSRTLLNAIALESDKAASLDISTNDFASPSFFPHDLAASDAQPLVHGFISSNRIADFIFQVKIKVIQKLTPGLRKEGYVEQSEDTPSSSSSSLTQPHPDNAGPSRPQPDTPLYPPDHHDHFPYNSHIPPENPLSIGRRDLEPFPQNPFAPPPLFSPPSRGDGMFVGPDHPIFGGGRRGVGGRGPWGGDGFLPPMGAPPGARFDPVGPGLGPFPGRSGLRGPPGGGNLHEPDNDEFMPPGAGDMYM